MALAAANHADASICYRACDRLRTDHRGTAEAAIADLLTRAMSSGAASAAAAPRNAASVASGGGGGGGRQPSLTILAASRDPFGTLPDELPVRAGLVVLHWQADPIHGAVAVATEARPWSTLMHPLAPADAPVVYIAHLPSADGETR